jgi:hypothetical protein
MMKSNVRLFFLIIILTLAAGSVYAQPKKTFSKDPQTFVDELTAMFDLVQSPEQKEAGKVLMLTFSDYWLNGKFPKAKHDSIYNMCNIMLARKMKAFPNFDGYLNASILFAKSTQSDASYNAHGAMH